MTTEEFSNEFDVLYNNIMSNQAPGLDEYEKSVFLTKAQNEIVKNYFNPKGNKYQEGFDGSQKRQVDFSNLISTSVSDGSQSSSTGFFGNAKGIVKLSDYPNDVFCVINEIAMVTRGGKDYILQVIPLRYDEYVKLASKPYKQPLKNQAWRFLMGTEGVYLHLGHLNTLSELGYHIRYVKRPSPIILQDLGDLTIGGKSEKTECMLDEEIHSEILQRAVELAKSAYIGDLKNEVELGQRSE